MDGGVGVTVSPDEAGWFRECEQGAFRRVWFVKAAVPGVYGECGVFPDGVIVVHGGGGVQASGVTRELETLYNQDVAISHDPAGWDSEPPGEIFVDEDTRELPLPADI